MRGWLTGTLLLSLFVCCFSAMIGCEPAKNSVVQAPPPPSKRLTVVTPHNEKIRRTFQHNFSKWYASKHGTSVDFQWIDRGTPECLEYITDVSESPRRDDPRPMPDVLFGGGVSDHIQLAESDLSLSIDIQASLENIPAEIDGVPTRDAQGRWHATSLSSFGILYNARACEQRGIAPPAAWDDLTDPRFYGWIAMADPAVSGSTRECLLLILQQAGWDRGWSTIIEILANTRALVDRSSVALHEVETGVALATVAVNYDGMDLASASGGRLVYLNPRDQTGVNANAVSVLKTSANPELATEFVRYCVSEEGQKLWGLDADKRGGMGDTLFHYPISPAIYESYAEQLALAENPLREPFGVRIDPALHASDAVMLLPSIQAACGRDHVLLQQVWADVIAAKMPENAVTELGKPLFDQQTLSEKCADFQAAEAGEAEKMMTEWQDLFRAKYDHIRALARI